MRGNRNKCSECRFPVFTSIIRPYMDCSCLANLLVDVQLFWSRTQGSRLQLMIPGLIMKQAWYKKQTTDSPKDRVGLKHDLPLISVPWNIGSTSDPQNTILKLESNQGLNQVGPQNRSLMFQACFYDDAWSLFDLMEWPIGPMLWRRGRMS